MFAKCQFSISIICPSLISKFSTERKSFPFSHIHSFIHSFLSVWTHGFLLYWVVYNLLLFWCSHSPKWNKLPVGTLSSWALCPFDTSLWFFFLIFIYLAILGLSCGMWDLVPWPDTEPGPPALEAWSLSHWTTRGVPTHACDSLRTSYLLVQGTPGLSCISPASDLQSAILLGPLVPFNG